MRLFPETYAGNNGLAAGLVPLSAITGSRHAAFEVLAEIGLSHEAIAAVVHRPERRLRRDREIVRLEIAKAHHIAEKTMSRGAVVRELAEDAALDEGAVRKLSLQIGKLVLEPACRPAGLYVSRGAIHRQCQGDLAVQPGPPRRGDRQRHVYETVTRDSVGHHG